MADTGSSACCSKTVCKDCNCGPNCQCGDTCKGGENGCCLCICMGCDGTPESCKCVDKSKCRCPTNCCKCTKCENCSCGPSCKCGDDCKGNCCSTDSACPCAASP